MHRDHSPHPFRIALLCGIFLASCSGKGNNQRRMLQVARAADRAGPPGEAGADAFRPRALTWEPSAARSSSPAAPCSAAATAPRPRLVEPSSRTCVRPANALPKAVFSSQRGVGSSAMGARTCWIVATVPKATSVVWRRPIGAPLPAAPAAADARLSARASSVAPTAAARPVRQVVGRTSNAQRRPSARIAPRLGCRRLATTRWTSSWIPTAISSWEPRKQTKPGSPACPHAPVSDRGRARSTTGTRRPACRS